MAKKDKRLNRKKVEQSTCDVNESCNISDLTDSVEFADEPFDNNLRNKNRKNEKRNKRGGGC